MAGILSNRQIKNVVELVKHRLPQIVHDELLCRAAAPAAMRHLPAHARNAKLLRREHDARLAQHVVDDRQILLLVRRIVVDNQPEAIAQRDRLIHAVLAVELILSLAPILPPLPDEVAAVRRRIEQDVLRTRRDAALNGRFQMLVRRIALLKRKIVEEHDKPLARVRAQRLQDVRQVQELRLAGGEAPAHNTPARAP